MSTREVLCDLCKVLEDEDSTKVLATGFCADCNQNLCKLCSLHHNKVRCSQSHDVVPLDEKLKVGEIVKFVNYS